MTKIPWTQETWNPVVGCTKIAEGCKNCYAERMALRLACIYPTSAYREVVSWKPMPGHWNGNVVCRDDALEIPPHWRKPRKIFVCSMSDLFHPKVPFEFIDKVMAVIALCPQHTFQILTKRPGRMAEYFGECNHLGCGLGDRISNGIANSANVPPTEIRKNWPLPNLWLGTSISNQADADKNIPILLQIPAAVRFVSLEPMLERINIREYEEEEWRCDGCGEFYSHFQDYTCNHCGYAERHSEYRNQLDWVIIGCESGPKARLCSIGDIRNAVRQCKEAGVPVFVKQIPIDGKCSKDPKEWPKDLRVQDYPKESRNA